MAQEEAPSLGDLARNLRKNKAEQQPQPQPDPVHPAPVRTVPAHTVIDNDNLAQVMEDAKKARPVKEDKTVFSIDPASNTLKVSSPDVTCSLSFNARASSLLIKPVLIEDLPLTELLKLDGPGSIQDESLQLRVFNGTDWDIREITVGLTLERKPGQDAEMARARARDSRGTGHGASRRRAAFRRDPALPPQGRSQAVQHNRVSRRYRDHPRPGRGLAMVDRGSQGYPAAAKVIGTQFSQHFSLDSGVRAETLWSAPPVRNTGRG